MKRLIKLIIPIAVSALLFFSFSVTSFAAAKRTDVVTFTGSNYLRKEGWEGINKVLDKSSVSHAWCISASPSFYAFDEVSGKNPDTLHLTYKCDYTLRAGVEYSLVGRSFTNKGYDYFPETLSYFLTFSDGSELELETRSGGDEKVFSSSVSNIIYGESSMLYKPTKDMKIVSCTSVVGGMALGGNNIIGVSPLEVTYDKDMLDEDYGYSKPDTSTTDEGLTAGGNLLDDLTEKLEDFNNSLNDDTTAILDDLQPFKDMTNGFFNIIPAPVQYLITFAVVFLVIRKVVGR